MTRKLCGGCLRLRDYSEFQKSHTIPCGMQSMCRECRSRRDREHRQERREKGQKRLFPEDSGAMKSAHGKTGDVADFCNIGDSGALENSSGPGVGTVILPGVPEVRANRKTQNKCRYRVAKAIALGVLSRPQRCTICRRSRDEVGTLHAHHEDYTNPLSVVFLCQSCHEIVHGQKESLCLL